LIRRPVWPVPSIYIIVSREGVGCPVCEKGETDEPEDDTEDIKGQHCPTVVEFDVVGAGDEEVRYNDESSNALQIMLANSQREKSH